MGNSCNKPFSIISLLNFMHLFILHNNTQISGEAEENNTERPEKLVIVQEALK